MSFTNPKNTEANVVWNGLEEIKSVSILAKHALETEFQSITQALGAVEAGALFSALTLIEERARTCQKSIELIEKEEAVSAA